MCNVDIESLTFENIEESYHNILDSMLEHQITTLRYNNVSDQLENF